MQYPVNREQLPHEFTGCAIYPDGTKCWYRDGQLDTRGPVPTVEKPDGTLLWFRGGKLHRTDGPAIDNRPDGKKFWAIDGKSCKEEEFPVKLAEYYYNATPKEERK